MLSRIRIVLIETSHPGNIGAVARAMKNMGLNDLVLVSPQRFPDAEAVFRATGADDILQKATVVSDFASALSGCDWVIGASARQRKLAREIDDPKMCAQKIRDMIPGRVAIVFGRESCGLTNEELSLCHDQVCIPANPDFSSLNLAAAVQVIAYELRMAAFDRDALSRKKYADEPLANAAEVAGFYEHLRETLLQLHFLDAKQPKRLMERLQLLFNRAHLTVNELNILRGILKAIQK
ncbi:MAG: hypothetical protein A3I77_07535 [Gammaproteobacteria bacterium RIFCSPLOWO2_02_FULL_42_14]|nr:MAG: hypothetical protein A3B71_03365 [Gammaproteobacteria bacterium RIFCSPHIGHO2_02_FULL_42_43]OGT53080.1 MAG: hypothetical protein A3E54_08160 [Gammaproteobacteria bacterium RIFCSPHIGHO2_12_FULL_41_25]OGT61362.1 MAG: hypothetical protein A3I77_07535 [Gammaproteobacteria bacterium RIFCSPLOWO2_02_FULL_42_14]OGT87290.1 MAG: hypothetical protein A3G86_01255 [Gammaproteobacteria bacterium RIFCSPLOWO2_12_FULL_42_18]